MGVRRILPLLLMLLSGCGLFGSAGLEPTAMKYYDFMVGHGGNRGFSNFISPAYKAQISTEDLQQLDSSLGSSSANTRFQPIKLEDVAVSVDGIYGLSRANPELGSMYGEASVKWVKVGKAWYLYMNTDAEIAAYGHFPTNLPPPQFIAAPSEDGD